MEKSTVQRFFRKVLRGAIKGTIGFVVLAGILLLWTSYLNRPPQMKITPPPLPAENAYDTFRQAGKAMRIFEALPRRDYSWPHLDLQTIDPETLEVKTAEEVDQNNTKMTQPDSGSIPVATVLEANVTALHLIRQGLQYQFAIPAIFQRRGDPDHTLSKCAKLLEINALYLLLTADATVAANALLDFIHFQTLISSNNEYRRMHGYEQLQKLLPDLSANDAHTITARFEAICRIRPSYAESLEQYRQKFQSDIISALSNKEYIRWYTPRWSLGLFSDIVTMENRSIMVSLYAWTVPNGSVPEIADRHLRACVRVAKKPFSAHAEYPSRPLDPINWLWLSSGNSQEHLRWLLWELHQEGLLLAAALQGYRQQHQRFPDTLEALVSDGWLQQLPVDPFTQRDTICYRNDGASFLLYSRGPDGKDDGGRPVSHITPQKPIDTRLPLPPQRIYVCADCRGDVIYGIHKRGESRGGGL